MKILRDPRVAVGVDVETVEADRVGGRSVGVHEVALPIHVAGIGQHDLVEEANGLAVTPVHQHFGVFGCERVADGVHRCVGVGDGTE